MNGAQYSSDTSLPIIMSNVYCATNQTSLNACQFDMNNPDDCDHYYDVGLVCTGVGVRWQQRYWAGCQPSICCAAACFSCCSRLHGC